MDLFDHTRSLFHIPDGLVYLDGNSLGLLPRAALDRTAHVMRAEWGDMAISAWNDAGWIDRVHELGDRIGHLIGAPPGTVVVGETLSVRLFQALDAALQLRPDRSVILSDTRNFPTDLYVAQGLTRFAGDRVRLKTVGAHEIVQSMSRDVAAVLLTEVDYRSGYRYDMKAITDAAHEAGALIIWDLAHSAGAIPVEVAQSGVDFAAGCTYKYLNAGPGAPAFIYVSPQHADSIQPVLSGWMGHAAPFEFSRIYQPAPGVRRMLIGTPPILALAPLQVSLEIWDMVDIADVHARSMELSQLLIEHVRRYCPEFELDSPEAPGSRGSHVSFRFAHAWPFIRALAGRGVVGDFREPDVMRFGIAPLYNNTEDILQAATTMREVLHSREWEEPRFSQRLPVT